MRAAPGRRSVMDARLLAVVALALLAGCGGLPSSGGDADTTPTLTPAPVPNEGVTQVDGVGGDRLDSSTVASSHRDVLANASHTVVETLRMGPRDAPTYEQRTVMSVAAGGVPLRVDDDVDGPVARVSSLSTDLWWDGDQAYYRRPFVEAESAYFYREDEPSVPLHSNGRFGDLLAAVQVSSVESGPDGSTIVTGSFNDTAALPRRDQLSLAENATTTLRIDADGVVSRMAIGYDAIDYRDGRQRVRYTYRVRDVGNTTVEPPAWLDRFDERG